MAREGLTPTPSNDLDVFGKELPLTSAEKLILSGEETIFLRKTLSVEITLKKGETTEPRVLVISSSKCYLLSNKPTAKLETSFNFLRIQKLECTEKTLTFHLGREPRPLKFHLDKKDSIEILGLITAQLKNVFPITPLEVIIQTFFTPSSLRDDTVKLRDSLLSAMDRLDSTSLHGFITTYGFLCDFFNVPFNEEVTWFLKNVYLTHGFRDLKLHDFGHLPAKDVRPLLSALRHNVFFEGIIDKDNKTEADLLEEIAFVVNASWAIKKLVLYNCSLKPDNVIRLSVALKNNPKPSLTHLDLSHNHLDDKAMESLSSALESLNHGLHDLRLANCKITARAATQLANCMMSNKLMQNSLVHLDLSSNPLGPDPQGSLGFLKEPHTVATLKLSNCGLSFEFVTPVLIRGCQQHLRDLDLSGNAGRSRRGGVHGANVATQFQQFFSSAISITTISLSDCKLSADMTIGLLEGLCVNPNVRNIDLNLCGNDLGSGRDPSSVAKVITRTNCLERLNVSECGIDSCLVAYISAVRANRNITHLSVGKNFNGKSSLRTTALKGISQFLSSSDCHLLSLCLTDSHLRDQTPIILEALASNKSLLKLDISGNGMGNHGARYLAKTLLSNCCLREVCWDHNDTSLHGFRNVANSMEHNYTLRVMPIPLHDIGKAAAREPQIEAEVQRMQVYLCRNHSDERLKIELAARHRRRLLTATQQIGVVSRELVQLEDLLKWSERGLAEEGDEGVETVAEAVQVREEANKVVQLTDGLYSPHVETEQFESVSSQVAQLLNSLMGRLHQEHVEENSQHMVSQSIKACPSLLSDQDRNLLSKLVITEMGSEFDVARKTISHKVVSEIVNPISASNLDLAATISQHLVEKTLAKLEKINSKLIKLQKALQRKTNTGATPDTRVSRAFTFRVEGEDQPKVKRRRPVSNDSDVVDLPSSPLKTDAPQLQHVAKNRPKPARLQKGGGSARRPHKPAHLSKATDEVDIGEFVKAVKDAEENSARLAAEEETKAAATAVTAVTTATAGPVAEAKEDKMEAVKEEEKEEEEGEEEEGTKEEEKTSDTEPAEDNDSEKEEGEKEGENEAEKSPSVAEKVDTRPTSSSPRSPPQTPPPSPPHDHLSPPLITTPSVKDELTNDNAADESSSSVETVPKKEASPSPSEDIGKDRKKSRKEAKKEEKEKKEKEKEEKEREKREKEERERLRREKEREEKEREKREKEERERQRREKEREEKEREKREKEEQERLRKEKEKEEKEREKKEEKEKVKKQKSAEDVLTSPKDQLDSSPGASLRSRKSKTVKENRKKGGLSKLFSRPKVKEEGDEASDDIIDSPGDIQLQKSPRRQATPKKIKESPEREDRTSMTPEPVKKVPPKVKEKPIKSKSVDHGMEMRVDDGDSEEKRKRPVGGVAAMPLPGLQASQLTGVLKPSPQLRAKPSSEENSPLMSDRPPQSSSPLLTQRTPPTAPRPRPKPKPRKGPSAPELKCQDEEAAKDSGLKVPLKPPSATPTVSPDPAKGKEEGVGKTATPTVSPDPAKGKEEGVGKTDEGKEEVEEKGSPERVKEGEDEDKVEVGDEDTPEDKQEPDPSDNQEPNEGATLDDDDGTLV